MLFVLLIFALVLIIAGVIARQGFLSAFLHFLCVIVAGAIAFALWEPLTNSMLDSTGGFAKYLSGTVLAMVFLLSLTALRMSTDQLVPENINFTKTIDLAGASLFGLASALLSVGIVTIAVGFLQFGVGGFGYTGWARDKASGEPAKISSMPLFPAIATARFYELLSVGSFRPMIKGAPLAQANPGIDKISWSLARDGSKGDSGQGRMWIQPKSIKIPANGFMYAEKLSSISLDPNFPRFTGAYILRLEVNISAFDNGNQFSLSGSQVRLIAPPQTSRGGVETSYPTLFSEATKSGQRVFAFDDTGNFVTSMAGKQAITFGLIFNGTDLGPPTDGNYTLQIKGLRVALPPVELVTTAEALAAASGGTANLRPPSGLGRPLPSKDCEVSSKLPMSLSYNMRGGLSIDDENFVTYGIAQFDTNMRNVGVSKSLRVTDFFEPEGTRIVQLNVARGAVIDSEKYRRDNRANEAIVLVDKAGMTFRPIGYVLKGPQNTDILIEPTQPIMSIEAMPKLPSAGTTTMRLLFRIPIGAVLREVRVGDEAIATLNVTVPELD